MADHSAGEVIISVRDVAIGFGERLIIDGLDLDVHSGEILGVVGGSGTGKSVLTRCIIGLIPKRRGKISVFGQDLDAISGLEHKAHRAPLGRALSARGAVLLAHA